MKTKVACLQMEPIVGSKKQNLRHSLDMIEQAAAKGAKLLW
ncbi:MAG: hypothetical protein U1F68_03005 [Gammaproteobacteria bacterium]